MVCATTDKDFKIFKSECKKWLQFFGLLQWDVSYKHDDEDMTCHASVICDVPSMTALVTLTKTIDIPYAITENDIRKSAFHEVLEIMLWHLTYEAEQSPRATSETIAAITHDIIHRFENTVFEKSLE